MRLWSFDRSLAWTYEEAYAEEMQDVDQSSQEPDDHLQCVPWIVTGKGKFAHEIYDGWQVHQPAQICSVLLRCQLSLGTFVSSSGCVRYFLHC
jgi:hypothetical protein